MKRPMACRTVSDIDFEFAAPGQRRALAGYQDTMSARSE
jgi:hypothetical protein